eukprot:1015716-Pelagomonas_calceolata.AAC.1
MQSKNFSAGIHAEIQAGRASVFPLVAFTAACLCRNCSTGVHASRAGDDIASNHLLPACPSCLQLCIRSSTLQNMAHHTHTHTHTHLDVCEAILHAVHLLHHPVSCC